MACCVALATSPTLAADTAIVPVTVTVQPMAMIEFLDPMLLYLEIPPQAATPPGTVRFLVTGNASATITAIPHEFVEIPDEGFMGKAILGTSVLGYRLQVHFPRSAPGVQIATLPGSDGDGTPPLTVNLLLTGGSRQGELRIDAHPDWTPDGGMPALGIHVGEVILTLTASP